MTTINNRLKEALLSGWQKSDGSINYSSASRDLKISRQTIMHWIKTPNVEARLSNLVSLSSHSGYSLQWLQTGKGQKFLNATLSDGALKDKNVNSVKTTLERVPLISWDGIEGFLMGEVDGLLGMYLCPIEHSNKTIVLIVKGRSMEPEYPEGEWIYVDTAKSPQSNDDVIVNINGSGNYLFRQYFKEGNHQYLMARSPSWPEVTPITNTTKIVGVVIFRGRPVPALSLGFQMR